MVFVVASSQVGQVLTVALLTGAIFFVLGLIVVSPEMLDSWTRGAGRPDGHLLGMTLPVPDALIQTTMLLAAITFMYLSAKAVSDTAYRAQFLDPCWMTCGVLLWRAGSLIAPQCRADAN